MKSTRPPVLEVTDLCRDFRGRRILNDVSFTVREGEITVIMGGSGCGKSTLLRHLVGVLKPTSGSIKLFEQEITEMREKDLDAVRRRMGMLFQSGALLQSLTVGENVALPMQQHTKLHESEIDTVVKMKLELVGLTGFQNHKPAEISGGMKKRAGLARALALDPEVLFCDEPTAGLDPIMTAVVDESILKLTRALRMTCVIVTHDMTSAFRVATNMIMLAPSPTGGCVIAQGTPDEIRAHPDRAVQAFILGEADADSVGHEDYVPRLLGHK